MFKFRLQRVLELRQKREQAVAVQLAEAQQAEEAARAECATLEAQREAGVQSSHAAPGTRPTVGQLQNLRLLVERLSERVEQAYAAHAEAEKVVQTRQSELTTAFQERRVLDRLRERDLSQWQANQAHADRQLMDDIALSRFVRASSNVSAPEENK